MAQEETPQERTYRLIREHVEATDRARENALAADRERLARLVEEERTYQRRKIEADERNQTPSRPPWEVRANQPGHPHPDQTAFRRSDRRGGRKES